MIAARLALDPRYGLRGNTERSPGTYQDIGNEKDNKSCVVLQLVEAKLGRQPEDVRVGDVDAEERSAIPSLHR